MKILVLNCGSSSIKYKLFEMDTKQVIAQGGIEKIGLKDSFLKITLPDGEKVTLEREIAEHTAGIEFILDTLTDARYGCIKSLAEIDAVGHRVVHGGEKFNKSVLITQEVIDKVIECNELAPLHNPANLKGIYAIQKILPSVPQIAVFDTAFHQTMPDYAYMYALPSHRYVSKRVCDFLGIDAASCKVITAHIGNGGSIAAVEYGKSIDTSMGMTPVEGLVMGTRVGDLDLGVVTYLMEKEHLSAAEFSVIVNKKSGLAGVSGVSSDMRDITAAIAAGNKRADLARNMYIYHVRKYIGSYVAAMNGVDVIVFTGGIGENDAYVRSHVCKGLTYLGLEINEELNAATRGEEAEISTKNSAVRVCVIPTDEEYMIASDTMEIVAEMKK